MSKWKETNKYGIHESKAAYWRYTRRMDKEAEILKELEPNPPTHVDLTGFEDYIQRLREPKEPTIFSSGSMSKPADSTQCPTIYWKSKPESPT